MCVLSVTRLRALVPGVILYCCNVSLKIQSNAHPEQISANPALLLLTYPGMSAQLEAWTLLPGAQLSLGKTVEIKGGRRVEHPNYWWCSRWLDLTLLETLNIYSVM